MVCEIWGTEFQMVEYPNGKGYSLGQEDKALQV